MADDVLRVLIVDDVELARQRLARLLAAHADVEVVGEAADARQMLACVQASRPHLLLLDVTMPEQDGFSALDALPPGERPLVIFATAYEHYAARAFRVDAVDYLLKPVEADLLGDALDRARRRLRMPVASTGAASDVVAWPQRITLRTDSGLRVVEVEAIDWMESIRNYVAVHAGSETLIVRATLQGMLAQLDPSRFARLHRSIVVNVARIRELQPMGNGDHRVVLRDGRTLVGSRTYRDALMALL